MILTIPIQSTTSQRIIQLLSKLGINKIDNERDEL